jgi:hypothetical protein
MSKGVLCMAESSNKRWFWGKIVRFSLIAAVVPLAAALVVPLSAASAAPTGARAPKVEKLTVIMNPIGHAPVGTHCGKSKLFGLKANTIKKALACARTTGKNIAVWGFQFKSQQSYVAGVRRLNTYTGFSQINPSGDCPPTKGKAGGLVGWHAINNKKYKSRKGQFLECFRDAKRPLLIWTLPTQHVFFLAQDAKKTATINVILKWWTTISYG